MTGRQLYAAISNVIAAHTAARLHFAQMALTLGFGEPFDVRAFEAECFAYGQQIGLAARALCALVTAENVHPVVDALVQAEAPHELIANICRVRLDQVEACAAQQKHAAAAMRARLLSATVVN